MQLRLLSKLRRRLIEIPEHGLFLIKPSFAHFEKWLDIRSRSKDFLQPWEPTWPEDDLSIIGYKRRLNAYEKQKNRGWGRTYFLFNEQTEELLGGVSLTRITYDESRSATLGYWMGEQHAGKGYMQKTVPAVVRYAFNEMGLKRIDAACVPTNRRSQHLLQKCGFAQEGYAREYLEINGKREDHILFAILDSNLSR